METTLTVLEQLEQCKITRSSDIRPHEFLFSWQDTPCFPRGELVAITGKAKSGKTYLNSILMAAGLAESGESLLGLKRLRQEPLKIVWIDTEQSEDSTYEIMSERIPAMIGNEPDEALLYVYNLRKHPWQEREAMVQEAILMNKPDLVIFDGIRDIVGDINDYGMAQDVVGGLLKIASVLRVCIVCVLHQNKAADDKTLRGAIGTELQNKSFETYECVKDMKSKCISITQVATRKYDMPEEVMFAVSDGLPVGCPRVADNAKSDKFNPEYVGKDGKLNEALLFRSVLADKHLNWYDLRSAIMQAAYIRSPHFAETLINEAISKGILQSILVDRQRKYFLQRQTMLFNEEA